MIYDRTLYLKDKKDYRKSAQWSAFDRGDHEERQGRSFLMTGLLLTDNILQK
jgi:hypothetical protein